MDRETALNTLKLPADADRPQIIAAYSRLARRYPLQQFPDRHARLLQAKTVLLKPETAFKDILTEDVLNLGWLNQYANTAVNKETATQDNRTTVDEPSAEKQCLEALFRPLLLKSASQIFPGASFDLPGELLEMLEDLDPKDLQKMINNMGFN